MARFHGVIGYGVSAETYPGVWEESVDERFYTGDVIRNTRRLETGEKVNDDITVNNSISIVADAYANNHFFAMRYVEWMGVKWKITNVEVQHPRLILTIGGVYHGSSN